MKNAPARICAVFDCNTIIQAMAFADGAGGACMEAVKFREVELFVSKPSLRELRRVLDYPEIQSISPNMTPPRVAAFLDWLLFHATFVRKIPHQFNYPRDPDDEVYIDLAIAGGVDYLVTSDRDLLALMTGHDAISKRFRRTAPALRVVNPGEFLRQLRRRR